MKLAVAAELAVSENGGHGLVDPEQLALPLTPVQIVLASEYPVAATARQPLPLPIVVPEA